MAATAFVHTFAPKQLLTEMRLNGISTMTTFDVEVLEHKDSYELIAELPGFGEEDVALEIEKGVLKVAGERKADVEAHEDGKVVRTRRIVKAVKKSLRIPDDVDQAGIYAVIDKGILTIKLPKRPETAPRRVVVANGAGKAPSTPPAIKENNLAAEECQRRVS